MEFIYSYQKTDFKKKLDASHALEPFYELLKSCFLIAKNHEILFPVH